MNVQSVDSSSVNLLSRGQVKVFADGRGANLADVKSPEQSGSEAKQVPSPQVLSEAVGKANQILETCNTELRFRIHQASGEMQVKVINTKDNSVVREIPPTQILNFVADVKKMLGIIIDKFI